MEESDVASSSTKEDDSFEFVDCNATISGTIHRSYPSYYNIINVGNEKRGVCLFCKRIIKMKNSRTFGLRRHLKTMHPALYKHLTELTISLELNYDLYYEVPDSSNREIVQCRLCKRLVSVKRGNTSQIRRHLQIKHPQEYQNLVEDYGDEYGNSSKDTRYGLFYDITTLNKVKVGKCRLCSKKIKMKNSNTSGLKRHLLAKHAQEYKDELHDNSNLIRKDENTFDIPIKTEENVEDAVSDTSEDTTNVPTIEHMEITIKEELEDEKVPSPESFYDANIPIKVEPVEDHNVEPDNSYCVGTMLNDGESPLKQSEHIYGKYYNISSNSQGKVGTCRLCMKVIKMKNSNTSGLRRHLEYKHIEQYNEMFERSKQCKTDNKDGITIDEHFLSLPSSSTRVAFDETIIKKEKETECESKTRYTSYYTIMNQSNNSKCGICRLCSKSIKMTAGNTSGLIRHLKSKHPECLSQLPEKFEKHPKEHHRLSENFDTPIAPFEFAEVYEGKDIKPCKVEATSELESYNESVEFPENDAMSTQTTKEVVKNRSEPNIEIFQEKYGTYFNFSNDYSNLAKCHFCSTSFFVDCALTLENHLHKDHPEEYKELLRNKQNDEVEDKKNAVESSTYVVAIYSGSDSDVDGDDDKDGVVLSLGIQKRYSCYYTMTKANGEKYGLCQFCNQVIKMTKSNTSGLRRHLQAKHPKKYKELCTNDIKRKLFR